MPADVAADDGHALRTAVQHVDEVAAEGEAALRLRVGDDGRGFDPASVDPGHLGLKSMRERATDSGGKFTLRSVQGEGTLVTVEWRFQETTSTRRPVDGLLSLELVALKD